MRITNIRVENFQIIPHAEVVATTNILLFAGRNEQGKSSLLEGIRLALTGKPTRVSLKKDYPQLVRDGAKKGAVAVATEAGSASFTLPKGEHMTTIPQLEVLPILLNPVAFADMKEQDKRALLFRLCGVTAKPADVEARMLRRGCPKAETEEVRPLLISGFEAAYNSAKERVSDARGAWKATTGENYGELKGASWRAPTPTVQAEQICDLRNEIDELQQSIGTAQDAIAQAALNADAIAAFEAAQERGTKAANELPGLREYAKTLSARHANLTTLLSDMEAKATGQPKACPQLLHTMAGLLEEEEAAGTSANLPAITAAISEYTATYKPAPASDEALSLLPSTRKALDECAHQLREADKAVFAAEAAAASLSGLERPDVAATPQEELDELAGEVANATELMRTANEQLARLLRDEEAAKLAQSITEKAAGFHAEVEAWDKVADALSSGGIPSELLAEAIKPVNDRLRATSEATGWKQVCIDPDMTIRADGRNYRLLSESARFRADAAIAEAISHISGAKTFALDRVDMLDLQSRTQLMKWLHTLAVAGEVDTVLLFGFFSERPKVALPTFQIHWIENGQID